MPQVNFDSIIDRRGTYSLKWNVPEGELPLWVADMDFATAPAVVAALQKRMECPVFGYTVIPREWNDAYVGWWKRRYGYEMARESLVFCTGVVPAISSMVRKLTTAGENVVILTPVYNIFFNSIVNNGRNVIQCPLRYDGKTYGIDWLAFESVLADPQTSLLIFCNPHNPVGRIWSIEELGRVGELCKANGVTVISDEIHCDLTMPGKRYIPFASVSEMCRDISAVCLAPTKTFNIAGLNTSAVSVANPKLLHKVWRALNTDEVAEPNAFAIQAAIAAYAEGEPWLDALLEYIQANREYVAAYLSANIPQMKLVPSEATYLLWLDCREYCKARGVTSAVLERELRENAHVFISKGVIYGDAGEGFLRMNIACPRAILNDALERIKAYISTTKH